jgi:transposase
MKHANLEQLTTEELRALTTQLMSQVVQLEGQVSTKEKQNLNLKTLNDKLTHEIAILRRHQYGRTSESLNVLQISLLDDVVEADIAGIEEELAGMDQSLPQRKRKQQPKRTPLPPEFPRKVINHEPDNTQCACGCQLKRIGEDVSEKLDYTPGVFTVEHHVRGKWACADCESITQAPVPAQVIDKGIPTSGLLAQVLIAKYADHLPLYRQEKIFERAGLSIARSTLADWVVKWSTFLIQPS